MTTKWRTDEPPKDCVILADVGLPYAVIAAWNGKEGGGWVHTDFQTVIYKEERGDVYSEIEPIAVEVKAWMPLPETGGNEC